MLRANERREYGWKDEDWVLMPGTDATGGQPRRNWIYACRRDDQSRDHGFDR